MRVDFHRLFANSSSRAFRSIISLRKKKSYEHEYVLGRTRIRITDFGRDEICLRLRRDAARYFCWCLRTAYNLLFYVLCLSALIWWALCLRGLLIYTPKYIVSYVWCVIFNVIRIFPRIYIQRNQCPSRCFLERRALWSQTNKTETTNATVIWPCNASHNEYEGKACASQHARLFAREKESSKEEEKTKRNENWETIRKRETLTQGGGKRYPRTQESESIYMGINYKQLI